MRPRCIEPATAPVHAELPAVPSKSWTHRALVAGALAKGRTRIEGPLDSDDTRRTRDGLLALGIRVLDEGEAWVVEGGAGRIAGGASISCGASGTTARFLTAVAALGGAPTQLDGDASLRARPMLELTRALRSAGAWVDGPGDRLPLTVHGGPLAGGIVSVRGNLSSQFASALLLVAAATREGIDLSVEPPRASFAYCLLTAEVLARCGVRVDRPSPGRFLVAPQVAPGGSLRIEGDHSAASYLHLAAAVTGGCVRVRGLDPASLQPDARFARDLAGVGCTVSADAGGVTVIGPDRPDAFDWDLGDAPDLAPGAVVLALFARGTCRLRGLANLRFKESDRLTALAQCAARLGAEVDATDETLVIRPPSAGLHGGTIDVAGDHRIAMAFAVAGLRIPGVELTDGSVVAKSYPGFWSDFEALTRPGQN